MPAEDIATETAPTLEQRGEDIAARLFEETPVEKPKEEPAKPEVKPAKKKAEVKPAPVEEPAKEDEKPESEDEEKDEDVDYDAPAPSDKPQDEEPPVEDPVERETIARKMAKENGRLAKQFEQQLKESQIELDRVRAERDQEKTRREEIEALKIDPNSHPEVVSLREETLKSVRRGAANLGKTEAGTFMAKYPDYINAYWQIDRLEGEQEVLGLQELREKIIAEVGGFQDPYEDLDDVDRAKADALALRAMTILENSLPNTKKMIEVSTNINEKAKTGKLAHSSKEYEEVVSRLQPILDVVGDLPDEVIEKDPYSISSVVARESKLNPAFRTRLENAKKDVLEILSGPRPLTQKEIDKLQVNGTDLKDFYKQQERSRQAKIEKLLPLLVQGLVTRPHFKDAMEKLSKVQEEQDQYDSEFEVSRRATSPTKVKGDKPKDVKPPTLRKNSVLTELYGENYDQI